MCSYARPWKWRSFLTTSSHPINFSRDYWWVVRDRFVQNDWITEWLKWLMIHFAKQSRSSIINQSDFRYNQSSISQTSCLFSDRFWVFTVQILSNSSEFCENQLIFNEIIIIWKYAHAYKYHKGILLSLCVTRLLLWISFLKWCLFAWG